MDDHPSRSGGTGRRDGLKTRQAVAETADPSVNQESRPDVLGPPEAPSGQSLGNQDPLEQTIALAARAGQWAVVERLSAELEARRRERAGVVSLDAERARRDGKR